MYRMSRLTYQNHSIVNMFQKHCILRYCNADGKAKNTAKENTTGQEKDAYDHLYEKYFHRILFPDKKMEEDPDFEKFVKKPVTELKASRPPFVKSLFKGEFDCEALTYPQALESKRLKNLENNVEVLEKFVKEEVDPNSIDKTTKIPNNVLKILKELKLFGQRVPSKYGGLEFSATEYARVMEVLSHDLSVALVQYTHEVLCVKKILKYGTDYQKDKYLRKLTSGEWYSTYCLSEPVTSNDDIFSVKTTAIRNNDGWILDGQKSWVCNGRNADLLLVVAKTQIPESEAPKFTVSSPAAYFYFRDEFYNVEDAVAESRKHYSCNNVTVFLVDKNSEGISFGSSDESVGVRAAGFCDVTFNNMYVPPENVLGKENEGQEIVIHSPAEDRYAIGSMAIGIVKSLMSETCNYCHNTVLGTTKLSEQGLPHLKLAKMHVNLYAMESMVYLTCGLLDIYEKPDCSVESAIVKVFCSEAAWQAVDDCLNIYGLKSYTKNEHYERYLRDTKALRLFDVSNDILRLYISSMGLCFASESLNETVVKQRNPFAFPNHVFKMMWKLRGVSNEEPTLTLKLYQFLHPSLHLISNLLEQCVLRFQYAIQTALVRHGPLLVNQQIPLKRLADCVISIYAMTAVLGRASRSYCIGLRNADDEMIIAETFVRNKHKEVKLIIEDLIAGEFFSTDYNYEQLAKKCIKRRGHFPEHPLKDNF